MAEKVSIAELVQFLQDRYDLRWLSGQPEISEFERAASVGEFESVPLVGYLNFIRPFQIQIIGETEIAYLNGLGKNSFHDAIQHLVTSRPLAIFISDNLPVPRRFLTASQKTRLPLIATPAPGNELLQLLQFFLRQHFVRGQIHHGVFLEVLGQGVLLVGEPGIGKSELALELITRGHRLVADDAPEFFKFTPERISGRSPELLQDFLEVRGLGVLNIRAMFGDNAIKASKSLDLAVNLKRMKDEEIARMDRLERKATHVKMLDVSIPSVTLPMLVGNNMAVLVESTVRNQLLMKNGYNATDVFIARQRSFINMSTQ